MFDALLSYARAHPMTTGMAVDERPDAGRSARARLAQGAEGRFVAQEWSSGLVIGALAGQLQRDRMDLDGDDETFPVPLGLSVLLAGRVELLRRDGSRHQTDGRAELWCQTGEPDIARSTMYAGAFQNFTLCVPRALLEHWWSSLRDAGAERRVADWLHGRRQRQGFSFHALPAELVRTSARLHAQYFSLPGSGHSAPTLARSLQAEGLALLLLGQWLELPAHQAETTAHGRQQRAVQHAIDIIAAEFRQELSISGLARRVGLNECYLKRGFRERTSMGIAQYVRQRRLATALALLEEGAHSVRQVAQHVGYESLGHFAQAFRAQHGHLPSDVAKRGG